MADEKTDTASTPVPVPEPTPVPAKVELPETFQLDMLAQLRLASSNDRLGRMVAELRLQQMQAQQLQIQIKQYDEDIQSASQAQQELLSEIGEKHGVGPSIRRYTIDLKTGVCTLKKAPQPKG